MSEFFSSNIIDGVLYKLASIEIRKTGFEKDLKKLHNALAAIKAFLSDAEERASTSGSIRSWLIELQDACYAINDVVDEFELLALRKQVFGRNMATSLSRFFSPNQLIFRVKMGGKMKESSRRLYEIINLTGMYGIKTRGEIIPHSPRRSYETTSLVEGEIVGREKDKQQVLKLILGEGEGEGSPDVLPIVGSGGLGKTTLAELVYNDWLVRVNFELKTWICVSDDFDVYRIFKSIIEYATGTSIDPSDLDLLASRLRDVLREKRFLIVLDDVWNEDSMKWEQLKRVLVGGAKRSKIIVTVRVLIY